MDIEDLTTPERMTLVRHAFEKAEDTPKKAAAAEYLKAAESAWADQNEVFAISQMNAASRALF